MLNSRIPIDSAVGASVLLKHRWPSLSIQLDTVCIREVRYQTAISLWSCLRYNERNAVSQNQGRYIAGRRYDPLHSYPACIYPYVHA